MAAIILGKDGRLFRTISCVDRILCYTTAESGQGYCRFMMEAEPPKHTSSEWLSPSGWAPINLALPRYGKDTGFICLSAHELLSSTGSDAEFIELALQEIGRRQSMNELQKAAIRNWLERSLLQQNPLPFSIQTKDLSRPTRWWSVPQWIRWWSEKLNASKLDVLDLDRTTHLNLQRFVFFEPSFPPPPGNNLLLLDVGALVTPLLLAAILTRRKLSQLFRWFFWDVSVDQTPSCDSCGYNLTGNESGTCPECGTPCESNPAND